jgi:hypothetical protein
LVGEKMINLDAILSNVCKNDRRYGYYYFGTESDGTQTFIVTRLYLESGKEKEFDVYLNLFPERESLHMTVPIFEEGVFGNNIAAYYQFILESNAVIDGNAKIALFFWDDSNQPVIILSQDSEQVNESSLGKNLDYLFDVFIVFQPILDLAIKSLQLEFHPLARLKDNNCKFIDKLRPLLQ